MAPSYFVSTSQLVEWCGFWIHHDNMPVARPGVYIIQHLRSTKTYVGISNNLRKRLASYVQESAKISKKFRNALRKHGRSAFVIVPAYYSLSPDHKELPRIEAQLIAEFNAATSGYNTKLADGRAGPYGPFYAAIIRSAIQRRARTGHKHSVETKIRISESVTTAHREGRIRYAPRHVARAERLAALAAERKIGVCRNGHLLTPDNIRLSAKRKYCRICFEARIARSTQIANMKKMRHRRAGRSAEEMKEAHIQHLKRLTIAARGKPRSAEIRAKISETKRR